MNTTDVSEVSLALTSREREVLLLILEQALKEARVETHRTKAFQARKLMVEREDILQTLVAKLSRIGA